MSRQGIRSCWLAGLGGLALVVSAQAGRAQQAAAPVIASTPVRVPVTSAGVPVQGLGTTPFLGNKRGLGAYSVNYDRPATVRYARPNRGLRRFIPFARGRRWR